MLRHGTVDLRRPGQRSLAPRWSRPGAGFGAGFALLGLLGAPRPAGGQSRIEGVEAWAEAVVGRSTSKWVGQRVEFPSASPRPPSLGRLDSLSIPLSVHVSATARAGRAPEVLRSAETAMALLAGAGLFDVHGDGGQAGTWNRDLYLVDASPEQPGETPRSGARLDATQPVGALDGARAFALLDARVPSERLLACTAQALVEAELVELDPAEAAVVRAGSAAYFAWLISGESCADASEPASRGDGVLHDPDGFFAFLRALGARMDRNSGVFVQSMWHFARQRTWEGAGLRGSPDLLEAIAKHLELEHTKLEEVAGELANARALEQPGAALESAPRVAWSALPAHLPPASPAPAPLDSAFLLIDLEQTRAGQQLRVWSRGEVGPRWVLTATRLDAGGRALASVNAPVRRIPDAELHVELDARTRYVLVSVTNLAGGVPDPDLPLGPFERGVRLIVDAGLAR